MANKTQEKFETRMVMTVPGHGQITIEGNDHFVFEFFKLVKTEFVQQIQSALFNNQVAREVELIETEKGAELRIVDKAQAAS